jgi:hypothetical protein|eukprot:COSAG02_NODE_186_length_30414_cov_24.815372_16_plen_220_part_00
MDTEAPAERIAGDVAVPPHPVPEPKPALASGTPPASGGTIPFRTITWGDVGEGIKAALKPDVEPKVVAGNVVFLLVIVALTVCKAWSLAASGHCGKIFQNVSLHTATDGCATSAVVSARAAHRNECVVGALAQQQTVACSARRLHAAHIVDGGRRCVVCVCVRVHARAQITDLLIFILIGGYSLWLLQFLKGQHPPEVQSAFSIPSLVVCPLPTHNCTE